jgi:hypothetical protein
MIREEGGTRVSIVGWMNRVFRSISPPKMDMGSLLQCFSEQRAQSQQNVCRLLSGSNAQTLQMTN